LAVFKDMQDLQEKERNVEQPKMALSRQQMGNKE
jgi:hypothetical protein